MKNIDLNKNYISASLKNADWESKLAVNFNNANSPLKCFLRVSMQYLITLAH